MSFRDFHPEFQRLAWLTQCDREVSKDSAFLSRVRMSPTEEAKNELLLPLFVAFEKLTNPDKMNFLFEGLGKKDSYMLDSTLQDPCDQCNVSIQSPRGKTLLKKQQKEPKRDKSGRIRFDRF